MAGAVRARTAATGAAAVSPLRRCRVAAAIGLSGWVGAILLALILGGRLARIEPALRMPRIVIATAIMGARHRRRRRGLTSLLDMSGLAARHRARCSSLSRLRLAVYLGALQAFGVTSLAKAVTAIGPRM